MAPAAKQSASMETIPPAKPLAPAEATELHYLEPSTLAFARHGATLRVTIADELCVLAASVVRMFPLSEPERYLSIRDGENKEIGILVDTAGLSADSRRLVREELERRYLIPVVRRVLAVKERFGTLEWQIETDRGRATFTTRNLRENVVQPSPGRYLLSCVDNNHYDVRDIEAFDAASRAILDRHL